MNPGQPAQSGRLRVLYVDDEADICTIVEMALALDGGIECRTAGSAAAALAVLAEGWRPDIALLDMMMPVTGGAELLAALRANPATAALPVVLVTAGTPDLSGMDVAGVISKPFDPLSLPGQVRTLANGTTQAAK